jgi:PAS domain S-box-containing protein
MRDIADPQRTAEDPGRIRQALGSATRTAPRTSAAAWSEGMSMTPDAHDLLSRRIVAEAQDAIIYADREGTIRLWNAAAERLFGYSVAEAVGQSLDIIVPERLRERHWEGYHRVMATGVSRYGPGELLAVPGIRKDGTRISLEFSIAVLHDEQGAIEGIAAVLRDVTARWETDRALTQRLAELEAALRAADAATGDAAQP